MKYIKLFEEHTVSSGEKIQIENILDATERYSGGEWKGNEFHFSMDIGDDVTSNHEDFILKRNGDDISLELANDEYVYDDVTDIASFQDWVAGVGDEDYDDDTEQNY